MEGSEAADAAAGGLWDLAVGRLRGGRGLPLVARLLQGVLRRPRVSVELTPDADGNPFLRAF